MTPDMTPDPDIHLHSFCLIIHKQNDRAKTRVSPQFDDKVLTIAAPRNSIEVWARMRSVPAAGAIDSILEERQRLRMVSGDYTKRADHPRGDGHPECSGTSVMIDLDFLAQEVTIYGSLVGLPPVFYRKLADKLVITSDIHLLLNIDGPALSFDVESVRELATIGYPIGGKTLFKEVRMLPAGHRLSAGGMKEMVLSRHWSLPVEHTPTPPSWHDFLERQSAAFIEAMERINVSQSFLSLTAGMDTRAILAALTVQKRSVPAYTMSGPTLSLDARTARSLCDAYTFKHSTVYLDSDFYADLPFFCKEASRLSGGLASLSQAHEVFFYNSLHNQHNARLSGNLGNQVGRGGAENISLRNAGFQTFDASIWPASTAPPDLSHWYAPYLQSGGHLSFDFLLEQEIPFSSVGNYGVGNNFAAQQTPYADKQLIEISATRPQSTENNGETSLLAMRLKDLRHRFLGEPVATSFQRKFIKETAGAVAEIPINWGGRAKGGVSYRGIARGMMALADAVLASKAIDNGPIHSVASFFHIVGVHEYRPCNTWLKTHLKEFALDQFSSKSTAECGLFNISTLQKSANDYFSCQSNTFKNMALSLDLALAAQIFKAHL